MSFFIFRSECWKSGGFEETWLQDLSAELQGNRIQGLCSPSGGESRHNWRSKFQSGESFGKNNNRVFGYYLKLIIKLLDLSQTDSTRY